MRIALTYSDKTEKVDIELNRTTYDGDDILRGVIPKSEAIINIFHNPRNSGFNAFIGSEPRLGDEMPVATAIDASAKVLFDSIRKNKPKPTGQVKPLNKDLLKTKTSGNDDISTQLKSKTPSKNLFKLKAENHIQIKKTLREELLKEYERLYPVEFPTKKYIDLDYNFSGTLKVERVTKGTEYFGSRFGQDIEPKGYYCIQRYSTMTDDWSDYEFREVHISKPIVIAVCDDTKIKWKRDLSEMFNGLTGKRLTNKLIKEGYDAIITVGEGGDTNEIVLFK